MGRIGVQRCWLMFCFFMHILWPLTPTARYQFGSLPYMHRFMQNRMTLHIHSFNGSTLLLVFVICANWISSDFFFCSNPDFNFIYFIQAISLRTYHKLCFYFLEIKMILNIQRSHTKATRLTLKYMYA